MKNPGNNRQQTWLVLIAFFILAFATFDLVSQSENEALIAEVQPKSEVTQVTDQNLKNTPLAATHSTRLSCRVCPGNYLPGPDTLISSGAYPPDIMHGPPGPAASAA